LRSSLTLSLALTSSLEQLHEVRLAEELAATVDAPVVGA
jgi:hypothetical protein